MGTPPRKKTSLYNRADAIAVLIGMNVKAIIAKQAVMATMAFKVLMSKWL